jgi:DNA-directed RNA polymerase beta subunit
MRKLALVDRSTLGLPGLTQAAQPALQAPMAAPMAPPMATPIERPAPVPLRQFGDGATTRNNVFNSVFKTLQELPPIANDQHTLRLSGLSWADPDRYTKKQYKQAILGGETLGRRMKGTWELIDNASQQVLDKRSQIIARVPYINDDNTLPYRGNAYLIQHQQRVLPGIYTRRKKNDEIEAHANIMPRDGVAHRYVLDPAKGRIQMQIGQAHLPLVPVLRALGADDKQIKEAWGEQVFNANASGDDVATLRKLGERLLPDDTLPSDIHVLKAKIAERIRQFKIDPEVSQATLGQPYKNIDIDPILQATKKVLAVHRGEAEPDARDDLPFQRFYGPEQLLSERLRLDHSGMQKQLLWKIAQDKNLSRMPSGALTKQMEQLLIGSGLALNLEEVNPSEVLDKATRVTRMGEGGISSTDSIPDEARQVYASQLGFIDPVRTSESSRVGVDTFFARGARLGDDGQLYAKYRNVRTGEMEWKNPKELSKSTIAVPGELQNRNMPRILSIQNGKMVWRKPSEVDYEPSHMEDTFSPLGNLVPMKSGSKAHRMVMASRMITQALPMPMAEAPLVRSAVPGTNGARSFDEELSPHFGAIRSKQAGRVLGVTPDEIQVQYDDGTTANIELDNNMPNNRKTLKHQTAMVTPGQAFGPDTLLARSNFTDDKGAAAYGLNARVAYMPFDNRNYKDAMVVSESFAKRSSSEHAYQMGLDDAKSLKRGKKEFHAHFAGKYTKAQLENLGDDGLIKPGTEVKYGDPLIVAVGERASAKNRIHRQGQKEFLDRSVVWEHHSPGMVTDAVEGRDGPNVVVKSLNPTQIGDKISGRMGDKGVISEILPDHMMPHDTQGRPFEVLMSPLGTISRANASQKVESILGKIAEKTGQNINVPDFDNIRDLGAWAWQMAQKHGIKGMEEVTDPSTGHKVSVDTGNRFVMKLHHTAESKTSSRSGGGYSADESPSKGGKGGCFAAGTLVDTPTGPRRIEEIVKQKEDAVVFSRDPKSPAGLLAEGRVTFHYSWFSVASDLVTLVLSNGVTIHCTYDHSFVLEDGTEVIAGRLTPGTRLQETVNAHQSEVVQASERQPGDSGRPDSCRDCPACASSPAANAASSTQAVADGKDQASCVTACSGICASQPQSTHTTVVSVSKFNLTTEPVEMFDLEISPLHYYSVGGVLVSNSKRVSLLDVNALISHGAFENLRDASMLRGQRNDQWWLQFMQGNTPPEPHIPKVYEKFIDTLKGSGINVVQNKHKINLMAMTDKDVDTWAQGRQITSSETVRGDNLEPVPGGLFDPRLTGGHNGDKWSYIQLHEPIPNPVMEEPIRRLLGLTTKKFNAILSGEEKLHNRTGTEAIQHALGQINVDRELEGARDIIHNNRGQKRDAAVKRLRFLKYAQGQGLKPSDWMVSKVPVLPTRLRPISMMGSGVPLVSDVNYLYKELMDSNDNLKGMTEELGKEHIGNERLATYQAFKAVAGLGDPVTRRSQEKGLQGLLGYVFSSSPKFGAVQRRLLSSAVDNVGRAAIIPDPDLDMDQVGIPENQAFDMYSRFVVRRMVRNGMGLPHAIKAVKEKTDQARNALLKEMDARPVIINRAPVLHKYGILAFRPRLTKGDVMRISPMVTKGFNADFDGDAMQIHVPTTEKSAAEAYDKMLPSRSLISLSDRRSPVHGFEEEFVAGLFKASGRNPDSRQRPRIYLTEDDAEKAFERGEIQADDEVKILKD